MKSIRYFAFALALIGASLTGLLLRHVVDAPGAALPLRRWTVANASYRAVHFDLRKNQLKLVWHGSDSSTGTTIRTFQAEESEKRRQLLFATNGGIFNQRFAPLGLTAIDGVIRTPLNLRHGIGNFYLQPNGVFWIKNSAATIIESARYASLSTPDLALQSGPMLLVDGKINPAFDARSNNRTIRSGVGLIDANFVVIAISDTPVTFFEFASLFRDRLGCTNAMYLDGTISRMFVSGSNASDDTQRFATLLVVER